MISNDKRNAYKPPLSEAGFEVKEKAHTIISKELVVGDRPADTVTGSEAVCTDPSPGSDTDHGREVPKRRLLFLRGACSTHMALLTFPWEILRGPR